jgi:thiamine pyrophosphate-dependent acetolactate synthase large subunit-like protein
MASRISPLFQEADGLLAIGCRFSQVITGSWALRPPKSLAQIDIDPAELGRHYPVTRGVHADAREALVALLAALPETPRQPWVDPRRLAAWTAEKWPIAGMDLPAAVRRALPQDAFVVGDVTQLAYRMLVEFPVYAPRTFLHPAGAVSMGYALPAAIGVKAAFANRPVVAVVGDGCFQMTGMELATAAQEKLPVVVLLVNDRGLTLIKLIQERRFQSRFIGVELQNPDFALLAQAFGVRYWQAENETALENSLRQAVECGETAIVEMKL